MTKTITSIAALVFSAGAAFADPIEGLWQTEVDDGRYAHVAIAPCGANFCGTIQKAFEGSAEVQTASVGKTIVIDMAPQGGGAYKGKVWRPSNDKIYIGKVALSGDRLKLSGCVAGGLLCSKQTWARVQ
ncbi:MAG: DUF2147 domain-containing protein [Pseudomonadota bacterium]